MKKKEFGEAAVTGGSEGGRFYAQLHLLNLVTIMQLVGSLAPWLLLAFFGQHVSLSIGADSSALQPGRGQRSFGKLSGRGKFSINDEMQCSWSSRYAEDSIVIQVNCKNPAARVKGGVTDMSCDYKGQPQQCPGFLAKPLDFWRQVGRSFRKLKGKVCKEQRALVRTGICKRAPRQAHFKLDIYSSVSSAQSGGEQETPTPSTPSTSTSPATSTRCPSRGHHQRTAEEHCNSQWTSVCVFLLSILQNEDC